MPTRTVIAEGADVIPAAPVTVEREGASVVLAQDELPRRVLIGLVAVVVLVAVLCLNVPRVDARIDQFCADVTNRYRAALAAGNYDQANAAREPLTLSKC